MMSRRGRKVLPEDERGRRKVRGTIRGGESKKGKKGAMCNHRGQRAKMKPYPRGDRHYKRRRMGGFWGRAGPVARVSIASPTSLIKVSISACSDEGTQAPQVGRQPQHPLPPSVPSVTLPPAHQPLPVSMQPTSLTRCLAGRDTCNRAVVAVAGMATQCWSLRITFPCSTPMLLYRSEKMATSERVVAG